MTVEILRNLVSEILAADARQNKAGIRKINGINTSNRILDDFEIICDLIGELVNDDRLSTDRRIHLLRINKNLSQIKSKNGKTIDEIKKVVEKISVWLAKQENESLNASPTSERRIFEGLVNLKLEYLEQVSFNSGLYGRVYKAKDPTLNRLVAVKIVKPEIPNAASAINHALAVAEIDHPNIVPVYACGLTSPPDLAPMITPAFTMPWIEGCNLGKRLETNINAEEAIQIISGIASGISFLHGNELAHRDLHIGNVLIDETGNPRIIDVDVNQDNTLRRLSEISRKAAIESDVMSLKTSATLVARKAIASASVLANLDENLGKCDSIESVKECACKLLRDPTPKPRTSFSTVSQFEAVNSCFKMSDFIGAQSLITKLTDEARLHLLDKSFATKDPVTKDEFIKRRTKYEGIMTPLIEAVFACAFNSSSPINETVAESLESIADVYSELGSHEMDGDPTWVNFRRYPVLLVYYSFSIGAYFGKNFRNLYRIWTSVDYHENGLKNSMLDDLIRWKSSFRERWNAIHEHSRQNAVPISTHLIRVLRQKCKTVTPSARKFDRVFREVEYLIGLHLCFLQNKFDKLDFAWAPRGEFVMDRHNFIGNPSKHGANMENEAKTRDRDWEILKAGFFGGDVQNFLRTRKAFETMMTRDVMKLGLH